MPILPTVVLPKRTQHRPAPGIRVSPQLLEAAAFTGLMIRFIRSRCRWSSSSTA
jgi:hypothetical protein